MQERLKLLNPNPTGNLFIMSRERLMNEARMLLNLCEPCWQEALLTSCVEEKIKVVLTAFVSGVLP
jgi:hypothetical protein